MKSLSIIKQVSSLPFRQSAAGVRAHLLPLTHAFSTSSTSNFTEDDFVEARKWYAGIPESSRLRGIGELSYSRSSGPGGQNVNKVSSKAQLRVPLNELLPLVPSVLHHGLRSSRYYADKSHSLLIQADESRKQQANKETCYQKLSDLLVAVYKSTVPGETSKEQKDKVQRLQKAENANRLHRKKMHSNKKAARSGGFDNR